MMKYLPYALVAAALVAFYVWKQSGGGTVVLGQASAATPVPNNGTSFAQGPPYAAPAGSTWVWGTSQTYGGTSKWRLQSSSGAWQPGVLTAADLSVS